MAELRAFVFCDMAGSVRLKQRMPGSSDADRDAAFVETILTPHREKIDALLQEFAGRVVSTAGDGHFLVFTDAVAAARWAIELVRDHRTNPITIDGENIALRLSLHVGAPQLDPRDPNNYVGKTVDYAARLNDLASSGQILLSRASVALLEDAGLDGVGFHSHGRRNLKGIGEVDVYQLLTGDDQPRPLRSVPDAPTPRHWTVLPPATNLSQLSTQTAIAAMPFGGQRIGKYELEKSIGTGGMGDVWLARHPQFDRPRALKVIKSHLVAGDGGDVIKRFYREIKAIGALAHPNIVVAIDSSLPNDDTHYLVMEYIDGVSASDLVARRGSLPVADACEIARQAAVGLQYIHRQNLVHRDIKPSNLMVTVVDESSISGGASHSDRPQPLVKILDLGLALLNDDDHERLTRLDHGAMGTAMYMSPEQWRTTRVDIRSDIYSLGCTLYHLLTGRPPFFDSDLRPQRAHELVPVPKLPAEVSAPAALDSLLQRMLAKLPEDRFATPGDVAEAIAPFCRDNSLATILMQNRNRVPGDRTHGAASDTLIASGPYSDTAEPTPRVEANSQKTTRRMLLAAGLAGAVAVVWGGTSAVWRSMAEARRNERRRLRGTALGTAAQFAASEVAREISTRFRILGEQADMELLQTQLSSILEEPTNTSLWEPLQRWIVDERSLHAEETPAESWFINDQSGIQVARAPRSATSTGESYAHRDYFHGEGLHKPKGTTGTKPLGSPHQSAVYESTTTGRLKVAFSVPVGNGAKLASERDTVGVLAMSVDLGDFQVLENELPEGFEVLLIDLRPDNIEGDVKRGLILHHHDLPARKRGEPPLRLAPELLTQIDNSLGAPTEANKPRLLDDYPDPLGRAGRTYWGAVHSVITRRRTSEGRDTRWAVLVQELVE